MIILRDSNRTEHDDYVLNVQDNLRDGKESVELRDDENNLIGWKVQNQYE